MTNKITIRRYKAKDYQAVKINLTDGDLFDPVWDSQENLNEKIRRNPESILVAEQSGQVIGSVYILEDGWGAFIFRLSVQKAYRNQGIGTELLEASEKILKNKGIKEVSIFVEDSNDDLKGYYTKRSYNSTGNYRCMYKKL